MTLSHGSQATLETRDVAKAGWTLLKIKKEKKKDKKIAGTGKGGEPVGFPTTSLLQRSNGWDGIARSVGNHRAKLSRNKRYPI